MKQLFILAILALMNPLIVRAVFVSSRLNKIGYSIALELKNFKTGGNVYLKRYKGKSLISVDSLKPVALQPVVFKGSSPLQEGMYCIVPNYTIRIDFFISKGESMNFKSLPMQTIPFILSLSSDPMKISCLPISSE